MKQEFAIFNSTPMLQGYTGMIYGGCQTVLQRTTMGCLTLATQAQGRQISHGVIPLNLQQQQIRESIEMMYAQTLFSYRTKKNGAAEI